MKQTIIRTGLETLYFTGLHHFMRPLVGGVGAILTLHHVRPRRPDAFQPNHLLEITPEFLDRLLRRLKNSGLDVISLDEMHARYISGDFKRRFVCITFDDGYKDLMRWAYPVLRKYRLPFALYIPTSFPDRLGELWWLALEAVIAQNSRIGMVINGDARFFDCGTVKEKRDLVRRDLRLSAQHEDRRRIAPRGARSCRPPSRRYGGILPRPVHGLAGDHRSRRRSAGHHRRAHRQPQHAQEDGGRIRRARRNGDEPHRAGSHARQTAAASGLSGRRSDLGRARASSASPPSWVSRPR